MASSVGFGFAETYVMRKVYNEKMKNKNKNRAQEEREEKNTNMKIDTTERVVPKSIGCFSSWVSKQQHKKNSRISDSSQNESATNI
ncbi:hypothetical protein HN51_026055 [Arachis hypogaea]